MEVSEFIVLKGSKNFTLWLPRACACIECPNVQDFETGKHAMLEIAQEHGQDVECGPVQTIVDIASRT
jgi:hypothetical protein